MPKAARPPGRSPAAELGSGKGDTEIPRDLYGQALKVFQSAGEITLRHRYEEAVE
jgi:hypothetical protein